MREFLRNTWARFKPWLERAEHLDFVVGKLSTVAWIIKLAGVPLSAGVIALLLGIVDRTPKALIFLFVLGAVVLALAMILLWKAVTAPTERPKQKTPITKGRKGIKKPEPQSPRPVGISGMLFTAGGAPLGVYKMLHIQQEADRLRSALTRTPAGDTYDRLYAAQQALLWATDPETFKAPFDMIIGSPQGSEGCPAGNGHSQSLDSLDHR